jgi:hypothetical protein
MSQLATGGALFAVVTHHDHFCVDFVSAANNVMATETQMEWSLFLNHHKFDDALEFCRLLTG